MAEFVEKQKEKDAQLETMRNKFFEESFDLNKK
jgi:hypothetical protein